MRKQLATCSRKTSAVIPTAIKKPGVRFFNSTYKTSPASIASLIRPATVPDSLFVQKASTSSRGCSTRKRNIQFSARVGNIHGNRHGGSRRRKNELKQNYRQQCADPSGRSFHLSPFSSKRFTGGASPDPAPGRIIPPPPPGRKSDCRDDYFSVLLRLLNSEGERTPLLLLGTYSPFTIS